MVNYLQASKKIILYITATFWKKIELVFSKKINFSCTQNAHKSVLTMAKFKKLKYDFLNHPPENYI